MITGLITKMMLGVLVVFGALSVGALEVAGRLPAHILMFVAGAGEVDRRVHLYQLERGMMLSLEDDVANWESISVSPDSAWITYTNLTTEFCRTLVDLHTWEMYAIDLPTELDRGCNAYAVYWLADGVSVAFVPFESGQFYQYDFASKSFSTHEGSFNYADAEFTSMYNYALFPGTSVFVDDGAVQQSITEDEDGFPRFYDAESDGLLQYGSISNLGSLSLSPDDTLFASALRNSRWVDVYLVPVWEGEPINLTNNQDYESDPLWSLDGRYISYLSRGAHVTSLHVYDFETGQTDLVLDFGRAWRFHGNVAWLE